ncbi:hypothetical protein JL720_17247 [Aureococcus anophagefferens]|nr:hypothetical protein JL720_17247 [Aureococcus anophagefferens]
MDVEAEACLTSGERDAPDPALERDAARPVDPHPKFTVDARSRAVIRAHVAAGSVEVALPLVAFLTSDEALGRGAMWATLAAEVVHASTAAALTPDVFGTKTIMVPAYAVVVAIKVLLA